MRDALVADAVMVFAPSRQPGAPADDPAVIRTSGSSLGLGVAPQLQRQVVRAARWSRPAVASSSCARRLRFLFALLSSISGGVRGQAVRPIAARSPSGRLVREQGEDFVASRALCHTRPRLRRWLGKNASHAGLSVLRRPAVDRSGSEQCECCLRPSLGLDSVRLHLPIWRSRCASA